MNLEQYDDVIAAINARTNWESKMSSYYSLRYDGIRRTVKPYKNAPDVHYPLVDTVIDKLKPFYAQQLYADLKIATFVATDPVPRDMVGQAEDWFDYKMKQCSNFEREIMTGIDMMLHYGICPMKIYWNESTDELAFEAIDPLYVIVPRNADKIETIDWLVQVKVVSRQQYEDEKNYKQGSDFVDTIVGRGSDTSSTITQREQTAAQREGLTYSSDKTQIVIWECYTRTDLGWQVDTIAPVLGADESQVRDSFILPYSHGTLPFVCLRNEVTTKGWYSPRGIAEILMAHELSLCKSWNSKLQFLDFFGHPVYKNDGLAPINASNFQAAPGRILPQGVEPVMATGAPIQFDEEMQFVRALAEDRIQIPDLGASQHLSGKPGAKGEVTATQVNAVVALSNQSNDLRSRLFRMQLADIYNQSWKLLQEKAGDSISYISDGSVNNLDPQLLGKKYTIHPSGSADSWNKAYKIQDATMTYQMLFGKPNVNQDELLKFFLETKDPRLAKRLYQDTGFGDALQGEKQANELLLMEAGHPSVVKPDDNDGIHLQNIGQWLQYKMAKGTPPSAETAAAVLQHSMGHAQAAAGKQDKNAMQVVRQFGPVTNMLQSIMAAGGMNTPEAGANAQGQPRGPQETLGPIPYKDAPPSIQRQMEAAAGLQPAMPEESGAQFGQMVAKAQPKGASGSSRQAQPVLPAPAPAPAAPGGEHVIRLQTPVVHVPAPVVHVKQPNVHVKAPNVHVPAPVVNVPAPVVNVPKQDKPKRVKIVRDKDGKITHAEPEY